MFYLMEVLSTFVESFVAFYAVTQMSLPRVCERRKSLYLWIAATGMTALVLFLNRVDSFSFLTIAVGFLCVIFGTHFTAKRNLICRTTATVISYLCIHGIDYVYIGLFGLICNHETGFFHTFQEILSPGPLRLIFLLLSKGTDIFLIFVLRRRMSIVGKLEQRYVWIVLGFGSVAYVVMSALLTLVQKEAYIAIQSTVLLAWILLVICTLAVICLFVTFTNYKGAEQRNAFLRATNEMMVTNYQKLNEIQKSVRRQIHDFNHHLRVIQELSRTGNEKEVENYLSALLAVSKKDLSLCRCGNDVIDAVINSKAMDAKSLGIAYHFDIRFDPGLSIDSVDLCAVLSNQIDNAIEACQNIPEGQERRITVKIWPQNSNMLFLQVHNSVVSNPFVENEKLQTTKDDPYHLHGYGLQNIREIALKYDGDMKCSFQDGEFFSTVYLFCDRAEENV